MKNAILKKFAEMVKKLRTQKGWSQENLAQKCGLHRTYIGSIEKGKRNVSLINIAKIAKALSTRIGDILND